VSESSQKIQNGPCPKCCDGKMLHPELYVFECNICGFKYRINPAAKKKDTIEILQKSIFEVRK
jgi:uncharacterized protein (DUF983 family)